MRWIRRWITEVVFFLGFIVLLAILAKMFYKRLPEVEQVRRIARAQKKQLVPKDLQLESSPEQPVVLPNFLEQAHGRTADKWYMPIPMVKVKLIVEPEEMKKWKKVYDQLMRQSIMTDDLQVWFKGTFEDIETGYRQPVRFRLRGDLYVHWARPNYSSLRIKFPKDKPWRHLRTVQFIVFLDKAGPIDFLANEIAGKLGLIHYRMGLAQFQLNNEKPQCYSFVETISEEMLALNRRSGSAVFSSDDRWLKSKYMFPGQAPESLPTLHFRNRYKIDDAQVQWKNLDDLLKLTQAASEDLPIEKKKQMIQQFKDLVNIDSYMRLCAMSVFFNSAHLHSLQNVKLYADPISGRFEPIQWDTNIYNTTPEDPLYRGYLPGKWLLETDDSAYIEYFRTLYGIVMDARQGLALFDACAKDVKKAFPDGRSLTGQPFTGYLKNFRIRLAQRYAFLGRTLHSPVAYIFVTRLSPTEMEVSLGAEGYAPVLLKTIYLLNMPETTVTVLDSSGRQIATLNSQAGSSRIQWNIKKNLIPGSNQIRPKDNLHTYRLRFSKAPTQMDEKTILLDAENILNGKPLSQTNILKRVIWANPASQPISILNWHQAQRLKIDEAKKMITIPGGKYSCPKSLICPVGYTLIIEAGAEFQMDPGTWLVVQGSFRVSGKDQAPVVFSPAVAGGSWGGIVVRGQKQVPVAINYLHLSGARAGAIHRMNLPGSLTLHQVTGSVENCTLTDIKSEDALNVVRSDIQVSNCTFSNLASDAIDFDWVTGSVVDCRFSDLGGDGIDINSSNCSVVRCQITTAGDKGISVGEGSYCKIGSSKFKNCDIGLAIKDGSEVIVGLSEFENCRIGTSLYRKKSYFDGGNALIEYCTYIANEYDLGVDQHSTVTRTNSIGRSKHLNQGGTINDTAGQDQFQVSQAIRDKYEKP